jgi:D-glycero-D-manno-heptose 1,7-bisphosphate phosphatase
MLEEVAARYGVSLKGVPSVGDSLRDLEAAANQGAQPILVLTGKGSKTLAKGELPGDTLTFLDLAAVATALA